MNLWPGRLNEWVGADPVGGSDSTQRLAGTVRTALSLPCRTARGRRATTKEMS